MHVLKVLALLDPLPVEIDTQLALFAGIIALPSRRAVGRQSSDFDLLDGLGRTSGTHVIGVDALVGGCMARGRRIALEVVGEESLSPHSTTSRTAGTDSGAIPAILGGVGRGMKGVNDGLELSQRRFDDHTANIDEVILQTLGIGGFSIVGEESIVDLVDGLEHESGWLNEHDERMVGQTEGVELDEILETNVIGKISLEVFVGDGCGQHGLIPNLGVVAQIH